MIHLLVLAAFFAGPSFAQSDPVEWWGKFTYYYRQFGVSKLRGKLEPVEQVELVRALRSDDGVKKVREHFETALINGVAGDNHLFFSELGGIATYDGKVHFYPIENTVAEVRKQAIAAQGDPAALLRLYEEHPREMRAVDPTFSCKTAVLDKIPGWRARGWSDDRITALVRKACSWSETGVESWMTTRKAAFDSLATQEVVGRYCAHWHLHLPEYSAQGWRMSKDSGPSEMDLKAAISEGRQLVLAFDPSGFDAYLFSGGRVRRFKHRSADWQRRFELLHRAIKARNPGIS